MSESLLDHRGFEALLGQLADAWSASDEAAAATCFTVDGVYMEPPDRQFFRGTDELTAYFSPLRRGTLFQINQSWFDPDNQMGCVEFTFGIAGRDSADHGVAVIQVRNGRFALWREYQREGPASFADFSRTDGKVWSWHAGNYP